jgi:uncharacterized membrane protein YbhN (UPF0104 family)
MTHNFRSSTFSLLIRVAVPTILLYFVFQMVSLESVVRAFRSADPVMICVGICIVIPAFAVRIHAWHLLLNSEQRRVGWRESAASFLVGQSFGFITPGGLGDFLVRGTTIKSIPNRIVIGLTLLDNALLFIFVAATGLAALGLLFAAEYIRWILVALPLCLLLILYANIRIVLSKGVSLVQRIPFIADISSKLSGVPAVSSWVLFQCFLLTGVFLILEYFQVYILIRSFSDSSFVPVAVAYAVVLFVKFAVPFAAGDLGVREISSVYLFTSIGISEGVALNAALIHFLSNNILPALIGGWIFLTRKSASQPAQALNEPAV